MQLSQQKRRGYGVLAGATGLSTRESQEKRLIKKMNSDVTWALKMIRRPPVSRQAVDEEGNYETPECIERERAPTRRAGLCSQQTTTAMETAPNT